MISDIRESETGAVITANIIFGGGAAAVAMLHRILKPGGIALVRPRRQSDQRAWSYHATAAPHPTRSGDRICLESRLWLL